MNKCFKCGTEFEGKFCPECGAKYEESTAQNNVDTQAVAKEILTKVKNYAIKYAPAVLFALWAVLLWAFYAAKVTAAELFDDFSVNLYQALKDDMFEDLFPVLNALLSFAIISNVYLVVIGLITWKGNAKAKTITNCGGILLQLAVFICALVTTGKVTEFGMENGSFVPVVASFTAIFAAISLVFIVWANNQQFLKVKKQFLEVKRRINKRIWLKQTVPQQRKREEKIVCEDFGFIMDDVLTISENARSVNLELLSELNFIKDIKVQGGQTFHAENSCLIDLARKTLVYGCQNSVIPDDGSVKAIGEFAFYKCKRLKEIVIPETVNYIGWGAFRHCKDLNEIKYTGSMEQWKKIVKEPYWYCTSIKQVICNDGMVNL